MIRYLILICLLIAGTADAQTFGSSTVETSAAALTVSGATFTPSCPTLGGGFTVQNIIVTAANQSVVAPASCPNSSVGLFVTFNICNGKGGTAPCNGTASGPFSPGIIFGAGFEFPSPSGPYAVSSKNGNNASGVKDVTTCEVMGTTGPWSCGSPQYALGTVVPSVVTSTAGTFTENPPANTASVVQQLTAGDILIVAESNFNSTPVSISSIVDSTQAGNISGCTQFTGLQAVSTSFSLWHCAIAASLTGGGNDTITATWSGTGQGYGLITAVVQHALANASLDDGIGAGSSTTITTGTTSQADLLLCAAYAQSISPIITGVTYNSGWTALQFGTDSNFATLGLASQSQTVAGTATCTATWSGTPQFVSNVEVVGIK